MSWFEVISEFLIRKKWEIMVSEDFRVLRDVPKKYITQSMCENAVERNYFMLRDVPKEYRTPLNTFLAFYTSLEHAPTSSNFSPLRFHTLIALYTLLERLLKPENLLKPLFPTFFESKTHK